MQQALGFLLFGGDEHLKRKVPSGNNRSWFPGTFLMGFLAKNPKVEIVALCDIYKPSIESALELVPNAKVYGDYREVLEDKSIDAILVATPLSSHCKIVLDAFDAGKHVFVRSR